MRVGRLTAGVKKPSGRAGRIEVQKLQKLFFEMPKIPEALVRQVEHSKERDCAKKGQIRVRVPSALKHGQTEALLQAVEIQVRAVERLRHVSKGVHAGQPFLGSFNARER